MPPQHPSTLDKRSNPSTIAEEISNTSGSTETRGGQKRQSNHNEVSVASDGKRSVLLPSILNVPVCDGTYRVTLRWKTTLDVSRISPQTQEMIEDIYALLDGHFDNKDRLLYKWQQTGTNCISNMNSTEVRQFMSPSIGIFQSQSMVVIPLQCVFSATIIANGAVKNPHKRNLRNTMSQYRFRTAQVLVATWSLLDTYSLKLP